MEKSYPEWERRGASADRLTRNLEDGGNDPGTVALTHSTNAPAAAAGNDLELDGETIESNWNQVTDK